MPLYTGGAGSGYASANASIGGGGMSASSFGAVSAFGSILSAIGGIYSGYLSKQVAEHNAKVAEAQAELVQANIGVRNYISKKKIKELTGTQRAAYSKAGVKLTGSPIDVMVDSQSNMELETSLANINDQMTASGYQSEAMLYKAKGLASVATGWANASRSLLSTAGDLYTKNKKSTIGTTINPVGRSTIGGE